MKQAGNNTVIARFVRPVVVHGEFGVMKESMRCVMCGGLAIDVLVIPITYLSLRAKKVVFFHPSMTSLQLCGLS